MNIFRMPDKVRLTSADVATVVSEAIFPFKPGHVTAWTSELRDFGETDIEVKVEAIRNYDFKTSLSRRSLVLTTPYEIMQSFYKDLFNHYRYRPALPVEDHIQLGEN